MDDNKVCYDKCTMILKYPGTYRTPPEDVLWNSLKGIMEMLEANKG